ncbi:unnamed protein product [Thelazia callipaeda]|uniref:Galectin n=1 Tax=Thelazia callipaeda TaxID=103827 RepID=A0A0N5D9N0_THECL|nr:unnamed protein product [Thelazia callipaeda]
MIPFKTRIKQPFEEGQTIHAVGMIKADPKRITIDFHKGADKNADLPLHLSIRFDEGKIVYNSFVDGNWLDNEKRLQNPFQANSEMDIRIRLVNNQYQALFSAFIHMHFIFANRLEWGLLSRNVPVDGVSHVSISGDLATLQLFHYGGKIFTKPYTAIAKLVPNMRLDISLLPTGERFDINIYRANRQYALQVSVRFNEGMVVRNAMENNIWGREEREGGMPIEKGYIFQIFFNGNHFSSFAHRSSPEDIATLEIDGDYELFSVTLNNAVEV